ncbi:MAG TPA: hypothetical protein VFK39_08260 [Gemmatimonadaceae bacterium]|nr:hypothetical protein [Gemmatimonadaceae bacterium]
MRKQVITALTVIGAASITAVGVSAQGDRATESVPSAPTVYIAQLKPLNSDAASTHTSGIARFTVRGDSLTISINVRNAPANMTHLQHFHGFTDGRDATCATQDADANHDGVVDLMETEPMSGTTMVPFTADPVSMEVVTDSYPKSNAGGSYRYTKTVSLSALEKAFAEKFSGQKLDLTHRVVYIHGVPSDTKLPSTAASLGTIPAQVTLPIACGKIEAVNR